MTVSGLQLAKAKEVGPEVVQIKTPVITKTMADSKMTRMAVNNKMPIMTKTAVDSKMPIMTKMAADSKMPVEIRTAMDREMPVVTKKTADSQMPDKTPTMPHQQALLALPSQQARRDSKTQPGLTLVETPVDIEVTIDTVATAETGIKTFKGTRQTCSSHEVRYLLRNNLRLFQDLMT